MRKDKLWHMSRISAAAVSKANPIAPLANDKENKILLPCAMCPSFEKSCSLFFTLIPTPTRSCQGIACHNCDFYPLQLDSPVQSQLLLEVFGHSFEAEAPQSHTTQTVPSKGTSAYMISYKNSQDHQTDSSHWITGINGFRQSLFARE